MLFFYFPPDLMNEIDDKAEGYLSNVRSMSPEKRTDLLSGLQKLFGKSREFGDDKVQLAMQTYEMVLTPYMSLYFFI